MIPPHACWPQFLRVAPGWIALTVYAATMPPTVTLEWAGQVIVAADHWGVPIPPGYPVWTMLAGIFSTLLGWIPYHGHPNPAWAVAFMSAVAASITIDRVASVVRRASGPEAAARLPARIAGFSASIILAFSNTFWAKAVLAEPTALQQLFFILFLDRSLAWLQERHARDAYALAVLFGLGTLTSQAFVLLGALIPFLAMPGPRRDGRGVRPLALLGCLVAGFLPVIYLPLASMHNPPMNWGYAKTWEGFLYVLGRGQFEKIDPISNFEFVTENPETIVAVANAYLEVLFGSFTPILALLGLMGLGAGLCSRAPGRTWHLLLVLLLVAQCIAILIAQMPNPELQTTFIARASWIPSHQIVALGLGTALHAFLRRASGTEADVQGDRNFLLD